jgi:hypothetical protein
MLPCRGMPHHGSPKMMKEKSFPFSNCGNVFFKTFSFLNEVFFEHIQFHTNILKSSALRGPEFEVSRFRVMHDGMQSI